MVVEIKMPITGLGTRLAARGLVLGREQGSFPGKGRDWAESICRGSSASFRPQHLEVQPLVGKPKMPIMALPMSW